MIERIESLMKERMKYYQKADYFIDTDKESIGTTVDKIIKVIFKLSKKNINIEKDNCKNQHQIISCSYR